MTKVTLIGKQLAKEKTEFIFHGPLEECTTCKLSHICFNLKPYHRYKIKKIRKKQHSCTIHQNNVVVVEVEHLPIQTAVDKKHTKGSTLTIKPIKCDHKLCQYHPICTAPAMKTNQKYQIITIIKDINCPKKYSLQLVEIKE